MKSFSLILFLVSPFFSFAQSISYFKQDSTSGSWQSITLIVAPKTEKGVIYYVNSTSNEPVLLKRLKDTTVNGYEAAYVSFPRSINKYLLVITPDYQKVVFGDKNLKTFDVYDLENSRLQKKVVVSDTKKKSPDLLSVFKFFLMLI